MRKFLSFMMAALFSASLFATTYTVAGDSEALFGTTWTPSEAKNDMVLADGSETLYQWAKENVVLGAGSVAFKVCEDHAWTTAYPSNNYVLSIPESGKYNVTISFDATSHNVGARATKVGDAVVIPTIAMHGNFTGSWVDTELFTKAADEQTASLTLTLAAGTYEFGMRIGGAANWTSNGEQFTRAHNSAVVTSGNGNLNLVADAAGEYTFTWTYGTNTLAVTFPAAPVQPTINYYLIGSDSVIGAWAGANAVAMVGDSAVVTLPAGVCEFKIVPSDWNWENALTFADLDNACSSDGIMSGDQGNIKVNMAAAGELKVKVVAGKLCVTGNFVVSVAASYYLVGSMTNNWSDAAALPFDGDSLVVNWEAGAYQFKIFNQDKSWSNMKSINDVDMNCSSEGVVQGDNDNIKVVLAAAGEVKIKVNAEGKLCITGSFGGQVAITSYTVVGDPDLFGENWNIGSTVTNMVEQLDGSWKYTIDSVDLLANHDYQYKMVANHSWDIAQYPQQGDYILKVEQAGAYKVEFTLVPGEVGGSAVATLLHGEEPQPSNDGIYLLGSLNAWKCEAAYKFHANEGVDGEFVLSTTLTAGDSIKVVELVGENLTWYPEGDNYVVDEAHAGQVEIYFQKTYKQDWADFGGFFFIVANQGQGVDNILGEMKAQKFIENGQLYILVNGKVYTVTGIVR